MQSGLAVSVWSNHSKLLQIWKLKNSIIVKLKKLFFLPAAVPAFTANNNNSSSLDWRMSGCWTNAHRVVLFSCLSSLFMCAALFRAFLVLARRAGWYHCWITKKLSPTQFEFVWKCGWWWTMVMSSTKTSQKNNSVSKVERNICPSTRCLPFTLNRRSVCMKLTLVDGSRKVFSLSSLSSNCDVNKVQIRALCIHLNSLFIDRMSNESWEAETLSPRWSVIIFKATQNLASPPMTERMCHI